MTPELKTRIEENINKAPVTIFMKGTKDFPQCGFSGQVAMIFQHLGVDFNDINILEDNEMREGIKEYSQWPTLPQVYVDGEFIGGCDIITEMFQSGDLKELLEAKLS